MTISDFCLPGSLMPEAERGLHSSGHASAPELLEIIETINPRIVIPIHTEAPELFADKVGAQRQVVIPKVGVPIKVPP